MCTGRPERHATCALIHLGRSARVDVGQLSRIKGPVGLALRWIAAIALADVQQGWSQLRIDSWFGGRKLRVRQHESIAGIAMKWNRFAPRKARQDRNLELPFRFYRNQTSSLLDCQRKLRTSSARMFAELRQFIPSESMRL